MVVGNCLCDMTFAGILAGGTGTRMATSSGMPKQFLDVRGVPIIVRTLRRFLELGDSIDSIIVAMHHDWHEYAHDVLAQHGIAAGAVKMIDGGATRFDSLVNIASACVSEADKVGCKDDVFLINHDCARPFVLKEILVNNLEMARHYDMVTTSIPTIDTVLISADGKVSDCVPERSTVFLDQGPQTIRARHFLSLVGSLSGEERAKYMEAGRLYIDKGFKVGIVPGDRLNFKVTTKFDLMLAEQFAAQGIS